MKKMLKPAGDGGKKGPGLPKPSPGTIKTGDKTGTMSPGKPKGNKLPK